jgi:small conductance mechanosensitive channel
LSQIGIDIGPLLAGAGIVGLAVGFGAQTLVKDIITGMFILLENQIAVGDVVKIKDYAGLVEALTIRTIRLRDLNGNVYIVPFSEVTSVENMTKDYSRFVFDVGVSYHADIDRVMEVLKEVGADLQNDPAFKSEILLPLEILGLERFEASAVIIRARITTRPIKQWDVAREFNRRMKKRFDELGIEFPFPQRTVRIESGALAVMPQPQSQPQLRERESARG